MKKLHRYTPLFLITLLFFISLSHLSEQEFVGSVSSTYFLDGSSKEVANMTCKDETHPCKNKNQIITAATLELGNVTLNSFNMTIKVSHVSECGEKPFNFSNFTLKFYLFIIGNSTNTNLCKYYINKNSVITELVIEGVSFDETLIFNGNIIIDKLILKGLSKTLSNNLINIERGVKSLQVSNSSINISSSRFVENIEITNSIINRLALNSHNSVVISDCDINDSLRMSNFQVLSIRNSNWKGHFSKLVTGESISLYNTTINSTTVFIAISRLAIENIKVTNGYFDNLFQIINVNSLTISGSSFYNNSISSTKSLISLQYVYFFLLKHCEFSFNKGGGFLSISNTNGTTYYIMKNCKFYNNQLENSAIIKLSGDEENGYYLQADSMIFNENSGASCFELVGGENTFENCSFTYNSAQSGAIHMIESYYLSISNSIFGNNYANDSGGAFYFNNEKRKKAIVLVGNVKCENNFANGAGGCIYSKSSIDYSRFQFKGNFASLYGNDIAYPSDEIIVKDSNGKLLENERLQLYPGQSISFRLYISDRSNQTASFLNQLDIPVNNLAEKATIYRNFKKGEGYIVVTLQIVPKNEELKQVEFQIHDSSQMLSKTILAEISPCPYSYNMKESVDGYTCSFYPLEIIIPTAILGMILSLIIVGFASCGIVYIIRKLLKLRKQERAEKEIENKFHNKNFIFGNEGMTESLLLSNSNDTELTQYIIPISEIDIIKKIGEGGMGIVYHARWNLTDVAIKQLKAQADDEEFEKESILMSSLRHPSIISCFGVCITTSTKYIVVEYMENGSLEKAIFDSKYGKNILKFERKLKILIDVAKGMTYLHSIKPHQIIHRDLKSANVLLDSNYNAKVGDFGLSRVVSELSAMTCNIGTLFYCSPEMLSNQPVKGQSTKLDVYSFSILMWELLFEMAPFSNELQFESFNSVGLLMKIINGHRPSLLYGRNFDDVIQGWFEHNFTKNQRETMGISRMKELISKYISLMEECWSQDPLKRPSFIQITDFLEGLKVNYLN